MLNGAKCAFEITNVRWHEVADNWLSLSVAQIVERFLMIEKLGTSRCELLK